MKGGARMSENTNRRYQDFAKYDAMTTEELEEILRLDLDAPQEQESDTEVLLHIMELLAQRRKNDTVRSEKTALEAFESFQQNYMPKDIHTATCNRKRKTNSRKPIRWLRTLAATAALVAIVFLGSVTAKAFGLDIWKAVVQWTEDTFHININDPKGTEGPGKNDNLPYASLEEALKKGEVEIKLVPTWFPEGFQLTSIVVEDTPLQKKYNQYRFTVETPHTCHAETSCLKPLIGRKDIDFKNVDIYIFRSYKNGELGLARPCESCFNLIKDLGIRNIYYSNEGGFSHEEIIY
jgi:hypothetical protein